MKGIANRRPKDVKKNAHLDPWQVSREMAERGGVLGGGGVHAVRDEREWANQGHGGDDHYLVGALPGGGDGSDVTI